MDEALAPFEAQFVEQDGEHLKMIVLLVAHHIDHFIYGEVLEAELGGTNVLGHVYAGAVATEQQFLIETFGSEVGPHRTVFAAVEDAFGQSFLYLLLTFEIGVGLIVNLVKAYTERLVSLVKTCIYPFVHPTPKGTDFGVVLLPLHKHVVGFNDERSLVLGTCGGGLLVHTLSYQTVLDFLHLLAVVFVEGYIIVTDEVVALFAAAFRCFAVAPLEPRKHRLADVDATVVDDIGLYDAVAIGFGNLCHSPAEQIVADMAKMERLVGVGRTVLYHHQRTLRGRSNKAVTGISIDLCQQLQPLGRGYDQVEEAFHHIVSCHNVSVLHKPFRNVAASVLWLLAAHTEEWESDQGKVSFKLGTCLLHLHLLCGEFCAIEGLEGLHCSFGNEGCYVHGFMYFSDGVFSDGDCSILKKPPSCTVVL